MTTITLPLWYDLHVHLRQGENMKHFVKAQLDMGCAGVLAMPNTKPPVAKVLDSDPLEYWSIEYYMHQIVNAGGDAFKAIIAPLYLTKDTSAEMITEGAASGMLKACKYYPPHGTTNSDHGSPLKGFMDNGVFQAMSDAGVVLCIHGEEHGTKGEKYFDAEVSAEKNFYLNEMPALREAFPDLKIVCEHITTKEAVEFTLNSGDNVVASVTPQHLLFTVGHLVQGLKYHLYCLPLVKFDADRDAIRKAVTDPNNTKFFAGTDSAPHTTKATECGCAAGCFTGGCAPQLYAMAFEESGLDLDDRHAQETFKKFLCLNGAHFYGLEIPSQTFELVREESSVEVLDCGAEKVTPLPIGLQMGNLPWSLNL
ncbi:MAG: amidohydrolase family protein [Bdellovibrionales bacterium]